MSIFFLVLKMGGVNLKKDPVYVLFGSIFLELGLLLAADAAWHIWRTRLVDWTQWHWSWGALALGWWKCFLLCFACVLCVCVCFFLCVCEWHVIIFVYVFLSETRFLHWRVKVECWRGTRVYQCFKVIAFGCFFVFVLLFWGSTTPNQVHEAEFAEEQFWATPPDSTEGNHADCALLSRWAKA